MRLTNRIKKEIQSYALQSIYRFNASTANCYAFNLCYNSKGKLDFEGGWDWSNNLVDTQASHLFMLDTKEFIKR